MIILFTLLAYLWQFAHDRKFDSCKIKLAGRFVNMLAKKLPGSWLPTLTLTLTLTHPV